MQKTKTILAALAFACLAGALMPATAQAAPVKPQPAATAKAVAAAEPDGRLWAWEEPYRGGTACRWEDDWADWTLGCWEVSNDASSLENRGYVATYDDVNLYYRDDFKGSYACLGRGDMWMDLTLGWEKFHAPGDGQWEEVNDNVASHKWVSSCV